MTSDFDLEPEADADSDAVEVTSFRDDGFADLDADFDSDGSAASPICPFCGVSALPPEPHLGSSSVCENPDCDAFGDSI